MNEKKIVVLILKWIILYFKKFCKSNNEIYFFVIKIFVGLVLDSLLQRALGSDLLRKFEGGILHTLITYPIYRQIDSKLFLMFEISTRGRIPSRWT